MENAGVPQEKIVIGKPVTAADAANTGLVSAEDLGDWCGRGYQELGWNAGIMTWQYISDANGDFVKTYRSAFESAAGSTPSDPTTPTDPTNPPDPTTPEDPTGPTTPEDPTTPPSGTIEVPAQKYVSYINRINEWWPPTAIAKGIGIPSQADHTEYNVLNLSFLLSVGPVDIALIWSNPTFYLGS